MATKTNGGVNKDEFKAKCYEVAYNYVNICAGNKTESLRKYYLDHGLNMPKYIITSAFEFFKHKQVQIYVDQFREENRKKLVNQREDNIAMLLEIATGLTANNRDKVAAIKELNSMCGFNIQNINVESNTITIELESPNGTD